MAQVSKFSSGSCYQNYQEKISCIQIFKPFCSLFPLYKLTFLICCQGELSKQPKISHFVDFDWVMHWNGLSGAYRVQGMPKQKKWLCYSGLHISGEKLVRFSFMNSEKSRVHGIQIQWCRFQVSMISSSWKIKISGKNFTFCWFWLGKCIKMAWVVHI